MVKRLVITMRIKRLPKHLKDTIISFRKDFQELNWKYAFFRNVEKVLMIASKIGKVEIVRKAVHKKLYVGVYSYALQNTAENGHTSCVELLIPVSDPTDMNSWALQNAVLNGHTSCVELLIPVSDPAVVKELGLVLTKK